jgi:putative transcriptional regulator
MAPQAAAVLDETLWIHNNLGMPATPTAPIYNRLPVLRAERGLSRAQLAALVTVNVQTIGALERGQYFPTLDLALRLCEAFGLPVEAVFSRQPFAPLSSQLYSPQEGLR